MSNDGFAPTEGICTQPSATPHRRCMVWKTLLLERPPLIY
jgi:hypothetical protein